MSRPSIRLPRRSGERSPSQHRHRPTRVALVGALALSLSAAALISATTASAAVPSFPDNLLVFPNRDFISVAGYQDHIGETATVELTRAGVGVVGSAQAVVAEGDVAFEINHPGGVRWGNGTGLKVTPDILPGDVATISFAGTKVGDTRVLDGFVTADAVLGTTTLTGDTVTVTGHISPDVIKDNTEQRIVEPALTATVVGRRDVRALPGPMTPAPKGGYSSGLEFNDADHTFTATYVFDDPALAKIAANAGLGERLLSWEVVDAAGNRQGVTISEFGEVGGPGFGGCPNGPLQSGPPGPTDVRAANVSGGVKLTWKPAVAIPGTPAITGYRATAVAQTTTNGEQVEIGRRIAGQGANGTTITGLASNETYDIEVVAVSSVGQTLPPVTAIPQTDIVAPTVSASPGGGSFAVPQKVTLTANESGSQIFYTLDGTVPVQVDSLNPLAVLYTAPFTVSKDTTVKFVAFDPTGNVSLIGQQTYTITNTPTPDAPTFGAPVIGQGQITLSWTAGNPPITGYGVQVYASTGAKVSGLRETVDTTLTVSGLTGEIPRFFIVAARNANGYGPESAKLGPLSPRGAVVANAGPDQSGLVRDTKVTLTGAGSTTGAATHQWTQLQTGTTTPIDATDPDGVTLAGATSLNPTFTLPFYKHPMTNKALTFRLKVTLGALTPPLTPAADDVVITPRSDVVTIGTAKWKAGDFRITGTATTVGGIVTVRSAPDVAGKSTVYGQASVTAAAPPAVGRRGRGNPVVSIIGALVGVRSLWTAAGGWTEPLASPARSSWSVPSSGS